jgi:Do/DeqQ family serine protease
MLNRFWLFFAQTITILLAAWFIVATLKPEWLSQRPNTTRLVSVFESTHTERTPLVQATSLSSAAKAASPAVVSISTSKQAPENPHSDEPWFRFFFGEPDNTLPPAGLGSGVIVSPEGFILTNNHVIEEAEEIEVQLSDGRTAFARVIGTDPDTDLAILKIDLPQLPVIVLGQSDQLDVGDMVLAIGNPFGVGQTVTSGIVSALGRTELGLNTFENFIQTDAAINPGNSGGALVDVNGHLMGINTAIYSRSGGSLGIGFAIPTSTARYVMEAIVRDGEVTRGWIGVEPRQLSPELAQFFGVNRTQGVIVTGVLQQGPAALAGLQPGDVIVSINDQPVQSVNSLLAIVSGLAPGSVNSMLIERRDGTEMLQITPAKRPMGGVSR